MSRGPWKKGENESGERAAVGNFGLHHKAGSLSALTLRSEKKDGPPTGAEKIARARMC
jgi:hypothetical protein